MENIKAKIAYDLMPLMRHLYDGGIIGFYPKSGDRGQIQMVVKCFRETFPAVAEPVPNPASNFPWKWTETVEGVEFFALSKMKEEL